MELIFCIVLGGLLLFGLGSAVRFPTRTVGTDVLRASGFPIGVIVIALVILFILVGKYILQSRKEGKPLFRDLRVPPKVVAVAGAIVAYMGLMSIIGFILSTLTFVFVNPVIMGYRKYRILVIFSVIVTAVLVVLFGKLLFVPLPRGFGILREISYYLY